MDTNSAPNQFRLSGAWNYRDVGGLRTTDGSVLRAGVLHRASALQRLDDDGRAALTELGVTDVFDLRGDAEIRREGADQVPPSVRVHSVPYWNAPAETAPHEAPRVVDEGAAIDHMMRSYTSFPTLEGAGAAIRGVVETIVSRGGGVLVHCAAGKDRAGWTVATILRAAGVTENDVLADYLRSNDAVEPLREQVKSVWGDSPQVANLTDAMLGVREEYYRAGLAEVDRRHGSFDGYLDHLGIDADARADLRRALLRDAE